MLSLGHLFQLEAEIRGQLDARLNPEFRLAVRALYVHMSTPLLAGEKVEAETLRSKDRWTHQASLAQAAAIRAPVFNRLRLRTLGLVELNPTGDVFMEFWR